MNEYEMLKAALRFINSEDHEEDFKDWMSRNYDMNDEEFQEAIDEIEVRNDDY